MKLKIVHIALLLLTAAFYAQAQKEAYWWHFKTTALDFNVTSTKADANGILTDGMPLTRGSAMNASTGSFDLSDAGGNLLMYSNGQTIWDKNNNAMPNGTGLLGRATRAQSGILVPYPGSPGKYYVIAADSYQAIGVISGEYGITYSVVDMALPGNGTVDSPLGDVVDGQKNITLLQGPTSENIAAVKKTGSNNYWLLHWVRESLSGGTMYVWELTPDGFTGPTTYPLPAFSSVANEANATYLKLSPDGKRFISPMLTRCLVLSGEFDPATGVVSDMRVRSILNDYSGNLLSIEFSMSGDHLFIPGESFYHMTWDVLRDETTYATHLGTGSYYPLILQMHVDGRMYGIKLNSTALYVIMDPEAGASAELRRFPNYLAATAGYGLPTFAANFLYSAGETNFCINTSQNFSLSFNKLIVAYTEWDFGDGSPVETDRNISEGKQTRPHTYTKPGTYTITINSYNDTDALQGSRTIDVTVNPCTLPVNPNIHMY